MTAREHIPLKVQLAAALLQLPGDDGNPAIPHEHAKQMTADQIISLFHRDHYPIRKVDGGPDEPWNLTWRFIGPHKVKTATIDVPAIAKGKRIRADQEKHRRRMLAKTEPNLDRALNFLLPKRKIPSRPFPKGRKIRNRR